MVAQGRYLASFCRAQGYAYTLLTLWDVERGKRLRTYDIRDHDAYHMALHPEGSMIAVGINERVCSFGLDDEEERDDFKPFKSDSVSALRYSPDGRTLRILCKGKVVGLDSVTGRQVSSSKVSVDRQIEVLDILDG
jgi:WD40 repeat protein